MPRKWVLHNRYLPDWLHRVFNGLVGGLAFLALGAFIYAVFGDRSFGNLAGYVLMFLTPPVAVLCGSRNPRRFSLVEGWAGGEGYDELIRDVQAKRDPNGEP